MPAKHVRFLEPTGYRVGRSTPSPSMSISSLPSSSGPITPPTTQIALPVPHRKASSSRITLHALLAVAKPRAINLDVSQHPSYVSTAYASLSSRPGLLQEPAIYPPVSKMTIVCTSLPWAIHVLPKLNGKYISVSDVLRAIYHGLRENVHSAEFHTLPAKTDMDRVTAAYQARYRRYKDRRAYDEEKKGGLKRVDFLKGKTAFSGLSSTGSAWVMNVS